MKAKSPPCKPQVAPIPDPKPEELSPQLQNSMSTKDSLVIVITPLSPINLVEVQVREENRKEGEQFQDLESEIEKLKNENKPDETENFNKTKLMEELEKKNSTIQKLQKKCSDYEERNQVLTVEAKNLNKKLGTERGLVFQASTIIDGKTDEIKRERSKCYSAQRRAKKLNELKKENENTIKEIGEDLKADLKRAKSSAANWQRSSLARKEKIVLLKKQLKDAYEDINVLTHKLEDSVDEVETLQSEKEVLNERNLSLESENGELKTEVEGLKTKNLEEVEKLRDKLEQKEIEFAKISLELEELKSSTLKEEQIKELQAEIERARKVVLMAQEKNYASNEDSEEDEEMCQIEIETEIGSQIADLVEDDAQGKNTNVEKEDGNMELVASAENVGEAEAPEKISVIVYGGTETENCNNMIQDEDQIDETGKDEVEVLLEIPCKKRKLDNYLGLQIDKEPSRKKSKTADYIEISDDE